MVKAQLGNNAPDPLPHKPGACLCCCHFAIDLESADEMYTARPSARRKGGTARRRLPALLMATD
jgi:hypothetical protein